MPNEKKSIRQWLQEIPDDWEWKEAAVKNYEARDLTTDFFCDTLEEAVFSAFDWAKTPEKYWFWADAMKDVIRAGL